jgi:hypothetical protein
MRLLSIVIIVIHKILKLVKIGEIVKYEKE